MGHTPGPWVVREPDPDERQADIAEGLAPEDMELTEVYAEDGGEQVCYVMNTTPNEAANARLIAAAPELLAALQEAVTALNVKEKFPVYDTDSYAIAARCDKAIAKAEGRSE